MPVNRFDQLVEDWAPKLRQAFLDAIAAIRDAAQVGLIAEMLERGDIEGAIRAVGMDEIDFRDLDRAIEQAYEDGGRYTAERLPALRQPSGHRLEVRFDVRNPRAEGWLREHSSTLITNIVQEQTAEIREVLVSGMVDGTNPRNVARDIVGRINKVTGRREGGILGLTGPQIRAVAAARRELSDPATMAAFLGRERRDRRFDRSIAKAIREGRPIDKASIDKIVGRYSDRLLELRGETIARTEALTSLHAAQMEATRQAIDAGQIQEAAVLKVWHNAADNRVRDTHRAMGGQAVRFEAKFVSPSGAQLRYPGDPEAPARETIMCRCWMEIKVDFLAGIT